ncbi:unnamed protein product, partial [Ectocarpus sp. 12 AP-2014]
RVYTCPVFLAERLESLPPSIKPSGVQCLPTRPRGNCCCVSRTSGIHFLPQHFFAFRVSGGRSGGIRCGRYVIVTQVALETCQNPQSNFREMQIEGPSSILVCDFMGAERPVRVWARGTRVRASPRGSGKRLS